MKIITRPLVSLSLTALALATPASVHAATPSPLARFECRERLGLDWAPTLLTYQVALKPGQARPGQVRVLDDKRREQPSQLSRTALYKDGSIASTRVSLYQGLASNESFSFTLETGKSAAPPSAPRVDASGPFLTLDNGVVAIRLLKSGEYKPAQPARFATSVEEGRAQAAAFGKSGIPGPFQGVRLANGRWAGGSFMLANPGGAPAPRVTRCSSRVTEQGPLFVEGRVRYDFDNGGFYQWTARVTASEAAIRIDEQSDLKQMGEPQTWQLVTSLGGAGAAGEAAAWKPDRVLWYSDRGNRPGRDAALDTRLGELGFDVKAYQGSQYDSGKLTFGPTDQTVFNLSVWRPWEPAAHYMALLEGAAVEKATAATVSQVPFLGVVPMHAGNWRNADRQHDSTPLVTRKDGDVAIHWPLMAARPPVTYLDSGEYDPALPYTFVRRQWALIGGPLRYHDTLYKYRTYQGFINLDDYKDWVLDWKIDPKVTFPRLTMNHDAVRRLAPKLDAIPGSDTLKKALYFADDDTRREQMYQLLVRTDGPYGPIGRARAGLLTGNFSPWFSYFRQGQEARSDFQVEELLSSPKLTPEQRATLRAHIAALCYVLTEPDFNPRGAAIHLGNPNMPINRFVALPIAASLIPDHPNAARWLGLSRQYLPYKLATMTAPGNAWGELLSYFMASAPSLVQAALVLDNAGRLPDSTAYSAVLPARYAIAMMTPPDPRFGKRFSPNWGHEGSNIATHWLPAAQLMRDRQPELAKSFIWAWDQLGRPLEDQHDAGFSSHTVFNSDLLSQLAPGYLPEDLKGQWMPGFGASMRAHTGDPDETYFALRQGYFNSHTDANQGDFILYSKGAPLSTLGLFQYGVLNGGPFNTLQNTVGWHNGVHFGQPGERGATGGTLEGVHAYVSGASVDYLRSLGEYGPQRWTRQVLFLKGKSAAGPNYFIFRDSARSLDGKPESLQPKWWSLRTPGGKNLVRTAPNEINSVSEFGPGLSTHFLQPATVEMKTEEATQKGPIYGAALDNWVKVGRPAEGPVVSEVMTVTSAGPVAPGADILVALYPRGKGEAAPNYESLADGAARITTTEGTDYVFENCEARKYESPDVSFQGVAGAVRIYPNEVHLVIAEGPATVTYKGTVLHSETPVQKIIPLDQLKAPARLDVPPEKSTMDFHLDPAAGAIKTIAPGVTRQTLAGGFAYEFDSPTPLKWENEEVTFRGRRGGIVVDKAKGTARFVLLDAEQASHNQMELWEDGAPTGTGPYDVTFYPDRVVGKSEGTHNFLYLMPPPGLDKLPMLLIDGQPYAPGMGRGSIVVPVMPGKHSWELRALDQPMVSRNWQEW